MSNTDGGGAVRHHRCTYNKTISGRCENQNFGYKHCSYHERVLKGLIEPQDQVVLMRDLPSMRGQ